MQMGMAGAADGGCSAACRNSPPPPSRTILCPSPPSVPNALHLPTSLTTDPSPSSYVIPPPSLTTPLPQLCLDLSPPPRPAPSSQEEALVLSQLRHPCICSLFGALVLGGDGAGGGFGGEGEALILEYLSGGSLWTLLHGGAFRHAASPYDDRALSVSSLPESSSDTSTSTSDPHCQRPARKPQLSTALACRIVRETASGLAFLHQNGYMHRDIKSTNILLCAAPPPRPRRVLLACPAAARSLRLALPPLPRWALL